MTRGLLWIHPVAGERLAADASLWATPRDPWEAEPELALAFEALRSGVRAGELPFELAPTALAYALVHRLRAEAGRPAAPLGCPLWPPSLLESLGVRCHATRELLALLPSDVDVVCARPSVEDLTSAARALGLADLDVEGYRRRHLAEVERARWATYEHLDPDRGAPARATSSGLLLRGDTVLLERRPCGAAVTPGVWDSPGGHLEREESPDACLVRELREELDIDPVERRLVAVFDRFEPGPDCVYRHFVYAVERWSGDLVTRNDLAWRSPTEGELARGLRAVLPGQ